VGDVRQLLVSTTPKVSSTRLKLLADGDTHSFEHQSPLVLRSLHDRQRGILPPPRLKLERTYYSAMTGNVKGRSLIALAFPAALEMHIKQRS
jgi:hypothetical protein